MVFIAFLGCVLAPATALAAAQDVLDDYNVNNSVISECHSEADYEAARNLPNAQEVYGDLSSAIDQALSKPDLVGTAAKPCPATARASGVGLGRAVTAVAIPVAVFLLGGGIWIARRRRRSGTAEGGE